VQLVISSSSIALLNFAAQKQVIRIIIIPWMFLYTFKIFSVQMHSSYILFMYWIPSIEAHEAKVTDGWIRDIVFLIEYCLFHTNKIIISDFQSKAIVPSGSVASRYDMVWHYQDCHFCQQTYRVCVC
jgi:hypothetical protein